MSLRQIPLLMEVLRQICSNHQYCLITKQTYNCKKCNENDHMLSLQCALSSCKHSIVISLVRVIISQYI